MFGLNPSLKMKTMQLMKYLRIDNYIFLKNLKAFSKKEIHYA